MNGTRMYMGHAPRSRGWRKLCTLDALGTAWDVWVREDNGHGVHQLKVVSTVPRARKANYEMDWSVRLGRLCKSPERDMMAEMENRLYVGLNEALEAEFGPAGGRRE